MRIASVSQILTVVDISEGGARLSGRIEETASVLELTLWWPHIGGSVTLRARVVRTDGSSEVGVRFEEEKAVGELMTRLREHQERRQRLLQSRGVSQHATAVAV